MRWLTLFLCVLPLSDLAAQDVPYGLEAVTSVRSSYVYRGFDLASTTLEAQLAAEITLKEDHYLGVGFYHLAAGSDRFRHTGAYLDYRLAVNDDLSWTNSLNYQSFTGGPFDTGLEVQTALDYQLTEDASLRSLLLYDFQTSGFFGSTEATSSHALDESSFLVGTIGLSYLTDYYERSGLNAAYARASYTYGLTNSISLSPFVGLSLDLSSEESDHLWAGLHFEVFF